MCTYMYYPTKANTVQTTVQIYSNICTVYSRKPVCHICTLENLLAVQVSVHTVTLSNFHYNKTKQNACSHWLIRHLLFAHECMLLTYSLPKAKRVLCDVAQFVEDSLGCAPCESTTFWPLTTLNHIWFVFYHNIKVNEIPVNICLDNWKHRLGLESARAALCKWAVCTRQTFLS